MVQRAQLLPWLWPSKGYYRRIHCLDYRLCLRNLRSCADLSFPTGSRSTKAFWVTSSPLGLSYRLYHRSFSIIYSSSNTECHLAARVAPLNVANYNSIAVWRIGPASQCSTPSASCPSIDNTACVALLIWNWQLRLCPTCREMLVPQLKNSSTF